MSRPSRDRCGPGILLGKVERIDGGNRRCPDWFDRCQEVRVPRLTHIGKIGFQSGTFHFILQEFCSFPSMFSTAYAQPRTRPQIGRMASSNVLSGLKKRSSNLPPARRRSVKAGHSKSFIRIVHIGYGISATLTSISRCLFFHKRDRKRFSSNGKVNRMGKMPCIPV